MRGLRGWRAYFSRGSTAPPFRAIDRRVYDESRRFPGRRHKVPSHGTRQFREERVFGSRAYCICRDRWARVRESARKSPGKPGNLRVRFDEGGREPGWRFRAKASAPALASTWLSRLDGPPRACFRWRQGGTTGCDADVGNARTDDRGWHGRQGPIVRFMASCGPEMSGPCGADGLPGRAWNRPLGLARRKTGPTLAAGGRSGGVAMRRSGWRIAMGSCLRSRRRARRGPQELTPRTMRSNALAFGMGRRDFAAEMD